ncbi:hypothetical protein NCAS_0B01110 [Naumovozyma castellii]|uniref:Protein Zds1 C-terminal domain-containing protein n=1 Tax=Naumovozyma castellii TaxID=27288 RepID=G0VB71_NAUCA|nr:hypothetical protein NCAS_0B01110 [Naumovozyma castellii CBS 4309]CCC68195.1 hypothetical protein NCAS_0B01110 [Naumovozyma castellii CBS 4309]
MEHNTNLLPLRKTSGSLQTQRDKRKSEVLIAAQSLDNEVQSVKNLKRLSIGSMDLLIDPELEFRVNNDKSNQSTPIGSYERSNENLEQINEPEDNENDESSVSIDDSIELTQTEYLHDASVPQTNRTVTPEEPSHRSMSGAGSLKRNGSSISKRKLPFISTGMSAAPTSHLSPSSTSTSSSSSSSSNSASSSPDDLTKNLLWVPANQHPNVKPENYLELVQDTLQNIHLEEPASSLQHENEKSNNNKENIDISKSNMSEEEPIDRHPQSLDKTFLEITNRNRSLVRRPSRLRTSYTEFEEDDYSNSEESEAKTNESQLSSREEKPFLFNDRNGLNQLRNFSQRSVSLKDITEELTNISNKAGLTDSDAITLARTLSMASSFSDGNVNLGKSKLQNESNEESEFASNMFMKNGLTIPERSSLRRSKFNTYRIRSTSSSTSTREKTSPLLQSSSFARQEADTDDLQRSPVSFTNRDSYLATTTSSPGSISDLYDHYQDNAESKQGNDNDNEARQGDLSHASISQESSFLSNESSNDSILVKPLGSKSMIHENLDNGQDHDDDQPAYQKVSKLNPTIPDTSRSKHKRNGWSWSGNRANSEEDATVLVNSQDEDQTGYTDQKSKSRHRPILARSRDHLKINKEAELPKESHKRETIEKRFVKLFRRKGHDNGNKQQVLKKKSSSSTLSKFQKQISKKNQVTTEEPKEITVEVQEPEEILEDTNQGTNRQDPLRLSTPIIPQPVHSIISDTTPIADGDHALSNKDTDDEAIEALPSLQPAVSVTSTKNVHLSASIVETVRELGEDDSQDISGGDLSTEVDNSMLAERNVMNSSDLQSIENSSDDINTGNTIEHVLPARKLTFADVKRPDRPNAPIQFTDSAFGFPLPMLTVSTVIMFDHRLGINVERAIYRLSHLKLSDSKRELRQQVLLSNFMYAYLNLVNHTLYMEQVAQQETMEDVAITGTDVIDSDIHESSSYGTGVYTTEQNNANGTILIPEI